MSLAWRPAGQISSLGEFQIDLTDFQGPLDLLLHLIDKQGLDITGVSVLAVTDQFVAYVRGLEADFADAASEFLLVGSQLALLKSRALLPQVDEEDAEQESLEDLAARLRIYAGFKSVASDLDARLRSGASSFIRLAAPMIVHPPLTPGAGDVAALVEAMNDLFATGDSEDLAPTVPVARHSVVEKIEDLSRRVRQAGQLSFTQIAAECRDHGELVVTFLALLHLAHRRQIAVVQDVAFGPITLKSLGDHAG